MAYHEAMGYLRKPRPNTTALDTVHHLSREDGWDNVKGAELEERIKNCIVGLTPRCKSVFILSRFEGKSYREIAEIMGISIKTVENQMSKALQILRKELQEYIPLVSPFMAIFCFF
jgi:RNA polymerase sigma-70 factor (ECF subfamily)